MRTPGLPVEQMFKYVRNGVSDATGGNQVPEEWTKLRGDFFFVPVWSTQTIYCCPHMREPQDIRV